MDRRSPVCRSVSLSVCLSLSWALQKPPIQSRCRLGYGLGWDSGTMYESGSRSLYAKGQFWGQKRQPIVKHRDSLPWVCKNGWTDRDAVWDVDSGGSKEHVLDGVHIGATWWIRLTVRMRRRCGIFVNLLWPLVNSLTYIYIVVDVYAVATLSSFTVLVVVGWL